MAVADITALVEYMDQIVGVYSRAKPAPGTDLKFDAASRVNALQLSKQHDMMADLHAKLHALASLVTAFTSAARAVADDNDVSKVLRSFCMPGADTIDAYKAVIASLIVARRNLQQEMVDINTATSQRLDDKLQSELELESRRAHLAAMHQLISIKHLQFDSIPVMKTILAQHIAQRTSQYAQTSDQVLVLRDQENERIRLQQLQLEADALGVRTRKEQEHMARVEREAAVIHRLQHDYYWVTIKKKHKIWGKWKIKTYRG